MTTSNTYETDDIGGFVDRAKIAADFSKSTRCVRNWERDGILPRADLTLNGLSYWKKSTYLEWKREVLAGLHAGKSRVANLGVRSKTSNCA